MSAARNVLDQAIREHRPSHVFALFSGGHDSVCSTYLAAQHPAFSGVVHLNTGIGIERTRQYVRDTCTHYDWPLLEYEPDGKTYRQLVLERGMPSGPKSHNTMYYWLKQRAIRRLVREHKQGRQGRVVLVSGIRSQESVRRMGANIAAPIRREGAQVWVQPINDWSALDVTRYMAAEGIPRNMVVVKLHRSGECLCGAFAQRRELDWLAWWFPEEAERIRELERECEARGLPCRWGMRARPKPDPAQTHFLPLCTGCQSNAEREA